MRFLTQLDRHRLAGAVMLIVLPLALLFANTALAQTGVSGQGTGASVSAPAGSQSFATATLPANGGFSNADLATASMAGLLTASTLTTMTSGMCDEARSSSQTSSTASSVSLMNGLVTARSVVAMVSSWTGGGSAGSDAAGSTFAELTVNGVAVGDSPAPNTRIDVPGGYVVLNEQTALGNSVTSSGMTVNMIRVVLTDPVTGVQTSVTVGSATSQASM